MNKILRLRILLALFCALMALTGILIFIYGGLIPLGSIIEAYMYLNIHMLWLLLLFLGITEFFVASFGIFFCFRPTVNRIKMLTVSCAGTLLLKIVGIYYTLQLCTHSQLEQDLQNTFVYDEGLMRAMETQLKCCGVNSIYDHPHMYVSKSAEDYLKVPITPLSCFETSLYQNMVIRDDLKRKNDQKKTNYPIVKKKNLPANFKEYKITDFNVYTEADSLLKINDLFYQIYNEDEKPSKEAGLNKWNSLLKSIKELRDIRPHYKTGCLEVVNYQISKIRNNLSSIYGTALIEVLVAIICLILLKAMTQEMKEATDTKIKSMNKRNRIFSISHAKTFKTINRSTATHRAIGVNTIIASPVKIKSSLKLSDKPKVEFGGRLEAKDKSNFRIKLPR